MNPTRNDLSSATRGKVTELLQSRLVDAIDLKLRIKNSHWNVKGPNFIALHELFDKVASDVDTYADDLAERAVQLGATAEGHAAVVAKTSALPAASRKLLSESDFVTEVADNLAAFGKTVRAAIEEAGEFGDADSADLFTGISRGVDKWVWFVESHLNGKR
jgi:starvation-inducible DNA-binding protein